MVKQTIQIFARIKPTKAKKGFYEIDQESESGPILSFSVPRELSGGFINNKKEEYKFKFEKVFEQSTKQDEIFENVAQPVIDNVITGYNGTIFAYGQTGSGKTFTITGGAERYIDRGIIPRSLSYIFEHIKKTPEFVYTVHVSYLEIYNNEGYDLLDPQHEGAKLEDLPKVHLLEDSDQNIHLKNLSTHQANSEEEALNLLFLGDTNRMIAETPMNQASTRSHCIFTIHISSREAGSATLRRAKLHLVDLAGSERVSKTGVNGILLTEAKYINTSLHYLELVIVALGEKGRGHIPYRNSMMTSVLRDSLGGNCMTTMIATCSVEKKNVDESISTCRFAQRVALIKNDAILNEELDPKLMIAKLKQEVAQLKAELAMATGEQRTDALSDEDMERCEEAVKQYLDDTDPEATLDVGADMRKIQHCYSIMKKMLKERPAASVTERSADSARVDTGRGEPSNYLQDAEVSRLKDLVLQRDNEINILVGMLKKEKKRAADAMAGRSSGKSSGSLGQHTHSADSVNRLGQKRSPSTLSDSGPLPNGHQAASSSRSLSVDGGGSRPGQVWVAPESRGSSSSSRPPNSARKQREEKQKRQILGDMSVGRQEAFEIFRRDYPHNATIEENKAELKQRYSEAKRLGEAVNRARANINKVKSSLEHHRMSLVMQGLVDPDNPEPDDTEHQLKADMEAEKSSYKQHFARLRHLKTEIEHLQHLLEKSKVQLMKDFELWWAEQAASVQEQQQLLSQATAHKAAWQTPPITPQNSQLSVLSDRSSSSSVLPPKPPSSRLAADIGGSRLNDPAFDPSQRSTNYRLPHQQQVQQPQQYGGIPLTGDTEADEDIMAFVKARQNVLKHAHQGKR